jgi:hypothetical protein
MPTPDRTRARRQYTRHRNRAAVRRRRLTLLAVVLLAFVVVAGALAWPNGEDAAVDTAAQGGLAEAIADDRTGAADGATTGGDGATDAATTPVEEASTEIWPDWKPTPQAQSAIDAAAANGRPPQFVLISFDGAADADMYDRWLAVAEETGARFTFYVSGIYLMLADVAEQYKPPRNDPGFSNLGGYAELGGSKSAERNLVDNFNNFNRAFAMGNEIGTHYVSHICEPAQDWTGEEWASEQAQWETLMLEGSAFNGIDLPAPLYSRDDFHGGRTPCLVGDKPTLYRVLKDRGHEYDTSQNGPLGAWPDKDLGLWNFGLPAIDRVGSGYLTLAMDYNFYVNHGTTDDPGQRAAFEENTYQSYIGAFRTVYDGNRAPLIIGSHFANWNGGVYLNAAERVVREACNQPEVACVTGIAYARWLDEQSPADLERWATGDFPKPGAGAAS